jgi:hypothetical protein
MTIRFVGGAVAVLALAACGGPTRTATDASAVPESQAMSSPATPSPATSSPATSSDVATSPAALPVGEKPTKEFVIGKWGTDGDCKMAIELRPDGTSDGPFGNWTYVDGVISFPEEPEFKVNVTVLDPNTMNSTHAGSDKVTKMTRCP